MVIEEGCVGGCNRDVRELIMENNKSSLHGRLFFSQGNPAVAIHPSNGGNGGGPSGNRAGHGREGNRMNPAPHANRGLSARSSLNPISHGSARVNGERKWHSKGAPQHSGIEENKPMQCAKDGGRSC